MNFIGKWSKLSIYHEMCDSPSDQREKNEVGDILKYRHHITRPLLRQYDIA